MNSKKNLLAFEQKKYKDTRATSTIFQLKAIWHELETIFVQK